MWETNRNLSLWVTMFFSGCGAPTGLLAGMWEFPSLLLDEENSKVKQKGALCAEVGRILGVEVNKDLLSYVGEVSAIQSPRLHIPSLTTELNLRFFYSSCLLFSAGGSYILSHSPDVHCVQCFCWGRTRYWRNTKWKTSVANQACSAWGSCLHRTEKGMSPPLLYFISEYTDYFFVGK